MGNGSMLGLLFEISADPSRAEAALMQFETRTNTSLANASQGFQRMGASIPALRYSIRQMGEETEYSLGKAHQGARLLEATLGIRLPRAVTTALADMMPTIGVMSTALVGVFAVEKVYEWGRAAVAALHEMQGETKEFKDAWDEIIKDQEHLLRNPTNILAANQALSETTLRLKDLGVQHRALEAAMKAFDESTQVMPRGAAAAAEAHDRNLLQISKDLNNVEAEEDKWRSRQVEQLSALNNLEAQARKDRLSKEKAAIKNREEILAAFEEGAVRGNEGMWKAMVENAKKADSQERMILQGRAMAAENLDRLRTEQHLAAAKAINEHQQELVRDALEVSKALKQLPVNLSALGSMSISTVPKIDLLRTALRGLTQDNQAHAHMTLEETEALKLHNRATEENIQYVASSVAGILDTLGAKREYAAAMAIFETAKGFEALGDLDFWAAGQDFASAAAYAKMAGGGGGSRGASGGGGGGSQSSYGRGGSNGGGSGGTGGASGGGAALPGGGTTVHLNLMGPGWTQSNVLELMDQMTQLTKSGQGYLVATNAWRSGPKQA